MSNQTKLKWNTEKRKLSDLKDHPTNPRLLSKETKANLLKSFKKFDYAELVVVDHANTILAGHQRVHVMLELGWGDQEIEVRAPNRELSKIEADGYLITSNKVVGEWDHDVLGNSFDVDFLCDNGFAIDELKEDEKEDDGDLDEVDVDSKYVVEITCANETEQRDLYEELQERGLECRILSL